MQRTNLIRAATMMEVVVTITLLSIVFMALLTLLPTTMMSIRQSEHRLAASALVQDVADRLKAGDYNKLLGADGSFDKTAAGPVGDLLRSLDCRTNDAVVLEPTLAIQGLTPTYARNQLCEVRITVTWTEKSGNQAIARLLRVANLNR